MTLDIVVVNHKTPELYDACIASLGRYMDVDYQLYGIDNSPEGSTVAPYVIKNRGYGQACNYGASLGSNPYILFLNADTEALMYSRTSGLLELFTQDPTIGIIGPKQVNSNGLIVSAGCPPANTVSGYQIRGWRELDRGQYQENDLDCKYVAGSVVFTRRDIWEQLGGFLETDLYYEETFYCYAARHAGYRCVYHGKSKWLHHWDSSPKPDRGLVSYRPVAMKSYLKFVKELQRMGYPEDDIPAFV